MTKKNLEDIAEIIEDNYERFENLNFSCNNFKEISPIFQNFENLIYLDMSQNRISKIDNLYCCYKLEVLNLSCNQLKFISSNFNKLKNLTNLNLKYNQLFLNDSMIKTFKDNPKLVSLSLEGNVNYNFEDIKYKCIDMLDKIQYLDDVKIFNRIQKKVLPPVNISVSMKKGNNVNIRKIKDYIKIKKKDYNENLKLYKTESNDVKSKTINNNYLKMYGSAPNNNLTSSYYFLNKNI